MKIQPIIPQQQNKNNNTPNFTGALEVGTSLLRFLDTNQAWGANAVDVTFMVIPRTSVDLVNRGPAAGTETARRESAGTFNHSMIGVYGSVAGAMLAASFNKKFGIRAHKIFADNETVRTVAKTFDEHKDTKAHLQNIFSQLETQVDGKWKKIPQKDISTLVEKFNSIMVDKQSPLTINKDLLSYSKAIITEGTGSQSGYRFAGGKNTFTLSYGIENIYNLTKAMITKNTKGISTEQFLKSMQKMNLGRSLIGLGFAAVFGMSAQPLNMYLTKKKTGSDGFVGVAGREKDNSAGFKMLKLAGFTGLAMGSLATITTNPKKLLSKLQFQGMTPTMSQLKFVYGLTIASRLLAARDKDEFRESAVKDALGFFNLLVLGSLVTKGVARVFDKSLINVGKEDSKNFFKWLVNSRLKNRDEILYSSLKERGIATIKQGKELPFKELLKLADKQTKGKIRALNIAQIAGYLYSGIVLGVGVPKLNIYMTNRSEARRKAKLAAKEQNNETKQTNSNYETMLKPENLAFLSKQI